MKLDSHNHPDLNNKDKTYALESKALRYEASAKQCSTRTVELIHLTWVRLWSSYFVVSHTSNMTCWMMRIHKEKTTT